jgi:hypothetical protein
VSLGAIALLAGLALAGILVSTRSTSIRARSGMDHVPLGFPMVAVTQDQSRLDPPAFPDRARFDSPWESPTHLNVAGLATDTAVGGGTALVLLLGSAAGIRRVRQAGKPLAA